MHVHANSPFSLLRSWLPSRPAESSVQINVLAWRGYPEIVCIVPLRDTFFTGRDPTGREYRRRYFMPGYPRFVCAVYPGQDSGFNALPGALNGEGSLKGFIWWLEKANGLVFGFLFLFPSSFLMESIAALSIEKSSPPFDYSFSQ